MTDEPLLLPLRSGSSRSSCLHRVRRWAAHVRGEHVSAAGPPAVWSAGVHRASQPSRASSHSASQTPAASPPDYSGCTPPGKSRRVPDSDRRWTYL